MRSVRVEELRKALRIVLNDVRYEGEHYEVMRYEETEAYIVPVEWYEAARAALAQSALAQSALKQGGA